MNIKVFVKSKTVTKATYEWKCIILRTEKGVEFTIGIQNFGSLDISSSCNT